MVTHDRVRMQCLPVARLADAPAAQVAAADVIGIDEGSFLPDVSTLLYSLSHTTLHTNLHIIREY